MAWYNKYRPQSFSDVIGQDLVRSVLENALAKNKIKHAYLFSGSKGVGKTTLARIFANELNELGTKPESKIDIIELDAASNTGIDDIRQLIESAKTPPIQGKYKIFIIDEVHMLSKSAMNALLKILEEPPVYIIFLLATTNPEKLLPTVLSRLTKLSLSSHNEENIIKTLERISKEEGVNIDIDSLKLLAKRSNGSQRDAINLLETIASYELPENTSKTTAKLLGLLPDEVLKKVASELAGNGVISKPTLLELVDINLDGDTFLSQLLQMLLDSSLYGDTQFDVLVMPIAEILDLKLPLSSLVSSVALLQIKLKSFSGKSSENISLNKPQPIKETPVILDKPKEPEVKPVIDQSLIEPKSENIEVSSQTEIEINQTKNIISSDNQQVSSEELLNKLQKLSQVASCPPILKMILQDIRLDKIDQNTIFLSITSGIFLTQLKSTKLQAWIIEQLKQVYQKDFKIEVNQRNHDTKAPTTTFEAKPEDNSHFQTSQTKPEVENPANNLNSVASLSSPEPEDFAQINKNFNTPDKSDKFYSVYNKLPANSTPQDIEVFKPPVPKPNSGKDWDDHTHQLFDFE